ncbi:MAG: CoA transferase [Acidobacteriia bacterium]|nr:CoA transferase [Terriglobia bacterium]
MLDCCSVPKELPLSGVRVFEFGSNVAGPYAGWILAEMGADVVKIERLEGDDARSWGPPFWNGSATLFHTVNRNKKSCSVDLKDSEAVERLRGRILREADVVLQNLRPGVAAELGFSAESLTAENPRLIYCNLHGYGARGPLKDRPGYDALVQAFGGIMSVTGEEGHPPVRAGISVIDAGTGMWCAIGILGALYRRALTGKGGIVDASLFETALGWMAFHASAFQASGDTPMRLGTATRGIAPYQGYACSDGVLMIAASNDRLFAKLARALDHPEWPEQDRFRTNPSRVANQGALNQLLDEILITAPREHWQRILDAAGVPNSPVQTVEELLAHPQTAALAMAQDTGDPGMKLFGLPLSFEGTRPPLRNIAPALGAGNQNQEE